MQKLIIAHRGASNLAPENSLEAFQRAMELGADYIELDVRRTKDGVPVIVHDAKYKGKRIGELTYGELGELSNDRVPRLEQALNLCQGKSKLSIELKEGGYEQQVLDLVLRYIADADFFISSFYPWVVTRVKKANPQVVTGLLLDKKWPVKTVDKVLTTKRVIALSDYILPHFSRLQEVLTKAKFVGKPVFVWTIDSDKDIRHFLQDRRISGIVTNRPDVALRIRKESEDNEHH